jgi:ribosomal protein S18 acetylase RimI-like enzyme
VRPATAADLPALLAVLAELHPDDPPPPDPLAVWRAIEAQPGRTVLVAVHGDAVVGTVDCAVLPNLTRGGRPFMQVENVVVAAAARRAGVGRALLTSALAMAREARCYKVQLLSRIDREAAHALYADSGLRPTAAGYRAYL